MFVAVQLSMLEQKRAQVCFLVEERHKKCSREEAENLFFVHSVIFSHTPSNDLAHLASERKNGDANNSQVGHLVKYDRTDMSG